MQPAPDEVVPALYAGSRLTSDLDASPPAAVLFKGLLP